MSTMHVRNPRITIERRLHVSHLLGYVSAYEPSEAQVDLLVESICQAQAIATLSHQPQYVDQDGEMFLMVNPNGTFDLCLRWKHYEFVPETENEIAGRDRR